MRTIIALALLVAATGAANAKGKILFKDEFDDGDPITNKNGSGGWGRARSVYASQAVKETNGALELNLNAELAAYALLGLDKGTFNFWTPEGVVADFVIRDTAVRNKNANAEHVAYQWQFAVVSADRTSTEIPWHGLWFNEGAVWFSLGHKDTSDEVRMEVYVYSKNLTKGDEPHPAPNKTRGYAMPVSFDFKIKYPATLPLHLGSKGVRIELPGQKIGKAKTAFAWSELGTAAITTEFQRGAWISAHGRIDGITDTRPGDAPLDKGPNSSRLESITVTQLARTKQ